MVLPTRGRPRDRGAATPEPGRAAAGDRFASGGHGLIGLRERARLLGGSLEYGAVPGAGFRVSAHLPTPRGAS